MNNHIGKLKELLKDYRVGMFGTLNGNHACFRPMHHVNVDDLGNLWYFTSLESSIVEQIRTNPTVCVTYSDEKDSIYVSVEGMAGVGNENKEMMKELFKPSMQTWFPDGLNDPNLALVKVRPVEIDYWKNNENKVLTYFKMLSDTVVKETSSEKGHEKLMTF